MLQALRNVLVPKNMDVPVPGKMERFLWQLQSAGNTGTEGDAVGCSVCLEGPGGYIYKSKVALNFSLLDVVARITTRTMSISARDTRVSS